MSRLLVNPGTPQQWEIHLKPGTNTLGRSPDCDAQIEHVSVSSAHCQVVVNGESVTVRDLGSTNGTFLNRAPIQEAVLVGGSRLQLGGVDMEFMPDPPRPAGAPLGIRLATAAPVAASAIAGSSTSNVSAVAEAPVSAPRVSLRVAPVEAPHVPPPSVTASYVPEEYSEEPTSVRNCKFHAKSPARYMCPQCQLYYCDLCVASRPGGQRTDKFCRKCSTECVAMNVQIIPRKDHKANFFANIPSAFVYPFKGSGLIFLILGSILFSVFEVFFGISLAKGWHVKIFVLGYTFAYMQKIIHAAAQGEDDPPGWPDISEFVQDLLIPGLQLIGTVLVCFGPAVAVTIWMGVEFFVSGSAPAPEQALLLAALALGGLIYFPMAVLAVAMYDTIIAINPLIVIPAMVRVPLEYLVVLLIALVTVAARIGGQLALPHIIPVMGIPNVVAMFLALYFLTVQMRLLGLMYYAKREKLAWLRST